MLGAIWRKLVAGLTALSEGLPHEKPASGRLQSAGTVYGATADEPLTTTGSGGASAARAPLHSQPPVATAQARSLQLLTMNNSAGNYDLFIDVNPGTYDSWVIAAKGASPISDLANHLLNGTGTFIDVGANIGTICVPVALSGSNVIAVELLPANCLRLFLAAIHNQLPNLRIVQAASTSENCLLPYGGSEAWGHIVPGGERIAVGLSLDTIVDFQLLCEASFVRAPVVVKIDVEGHELEVLQGACELLDRYRPLVIFESIEMADADKTRTRAVKSLLTARGYSLYLQRGSILIPRGVTDLQEGLVSDFLAIPTEVISELSLPYEVRPLRTEERLAWIQEMVCNEAPHRRHAIGFIKVCFEQDPTFSSLAKHLLTPLLHDPDSSIASAAASFLLSPD